MSNLKTQAVERSSASISAEIARLTAEQRLATTRLQALTSSYDAAILAGDKEAAANEAETTLTKRTIRRCELQLVALNADLQNAIEREREAAAQIRRDQATAAVAAVLKKFDQGYREPARLIAAFLREYDAATDLAMAAGVAGPHTLTRFHVGEVEPQREEAVFVYIDEMGNETDDAYPPGSYRLDDQGRKLDNTNGKPLVERPRRRKPNRVIPARRLPDQELPYLSITVSLPALTLEDGGPFWPAER